MTQRDQYILSTYTAVDTLHCTGHACVELVECSLDGKRYVKKTYHDDRRAVYRALEGMDCPALARVYHVLFGEDTVVVEEYIPGRDLDTELAQGRHVTPGQWLSITRDLLDALCALHERNIIHRDIKPGNIILRPDGHAVLLDLSIARLNTRPAPSDTELLGTVGYAAPEQFGFSQTDPRTDLYSLGVTLSNAVGQARVPKRLRQAIDRCTQFDPARRFQSAEEMRAFLEGGRRGLWWLTGLALAGLACTAWLGWPAGSEMPAPSVSTSPDPAADPPTVSQPAPDPAVSTPAPEPAPQPTPAPPPEPTPEPTLDLGVGQLLAAEDERRLVRAYGLEPEISCLSVWEDGAFAHRFGPDSPTVTGVRTGWQLELTVDGTPFTFTGAPKEPPVSYEDTGPLWELLYHDMNGDGTGEVLVVFSDGCLVSINAEDYLLTNTGTLWCLCSDPNGGFTRADGEARIPNEERFVFYPVEPTVLRAGMHASYRLTDRALVGHGP